MKKFTDIFNDSNPFVAKPGRRWKSTRTGNIYSETGCTRVLEGEMLGIIREPTGAKTYQPYVRYLELVSDPEPTGREAIHAAVDAYLDARNNSINAAEANESVRRALDEAGNKANAAWDERMKAAESLKKLLNL